MSTGQGAVALLYGWECNRRPGIAHTLSINGLRKGNDYPAYIPVWSMVACVFLLQTATTVTKRIEIKNPAN